MSPMFRLQPLSSVRCPPSTDVVVNATPLGMLGPDQDKTPLTSEQLLGVRFVYDLVTRREDTPLIQEARKAEIDAIDGVEMLIAQGTKQFEIWTGTDAPADVIRQAALRPPSLEDGSRVIELSKLRSGRR